MGRLGHKNPTTGSSRRLIAIRASALLRESLRSALTSKGFDVDDQQLLTASALTTEAELLICEVTSETEELAQRLLRELPEVALVFVGFVRGGAEGPGSEAGRRRNVHELSADVSVGEIIRVCQQQIFGTAPSGVPKHDASRTSTPFSVLPRPSDPPSAPSANSSPAPVLASGPAASSLPSGPSLSPQSGQPQAFGGFARPALSAGGQELGHALAQLLEEADQRVAERMRPRFSLPLAAEPMEPTEPLRMSPEIRAALEDPIGDYDGAGPSQAPPTARPQTQATLEKSNAAPAGSPSSMPEPTKNSTKPKKTSMDAEETASENEDGSHGGNAPALVDIEPIPAPAQAARTVVPGPAGTSGAAAPVPPSNSAAPGSDPHNADPAPESTTARPPAPVAAQGRSGTARPRRPPTPLPPDPLVPRGQWVQSALRESEQSASASDNGKPPIAPESAPAARPQTTRPSNPTKVGTLKPDTHWPVRTPRVGALTRPTNPSSQLPASEGSPPPRTADGSELQQLELAPLEEGDGVRVLAKAIRTRFSGAIAYEADGGIRRVVLKDGDLVTASSSVQAESLLAFLVERGRLEREVSTQLEHRLPNFGRHAGAALIASGHIAQDQLWAVLRAHAEFVVGRAVALAHGLAAYEGSVPERLQAEPSVFGGATGSEVLIEILRRTLNPSAAVARLGGPKVRLEHGPSNHLLDECALPTPELECLESSPRLTLEDILSQAPGPEFSCVLLGLVELQVLKVLQASGNARDLGSAQPRDHLDDRALRKAIQMRKAVVENGDYFTVLGVPHGATGYDVRRAYLELRRQFDPSTVLTPATADLSDDVDLILEVAQEAYSILHDQLKRERYRRAIESTPSSM